MNKIKYYSVFCFGIFLSAVIGPVMCVTAAKEDAVLKAFRQKSTTCLQCDATAELKSMDYKELNIQLKKTDSKSESYAEYKLQRDLAAFYYENKKLYADELKRNAQYQFLKSYASLPVYSKQILYQKAVYKELNSQLSVLKAGKKKGFFSAGQVSEKQQEVNMAKTDLQLLEKKREGIISVIKEETGLSDIKDPDKRYVQSLRPSGEYLKDYKEKNTTLKLKQLTKKAYLSYIKSLNKKSGFYDIKKEKAEKKILLLNNETELYNRNLSRNLKQSADAFHEQEKKIKLNLKKQKSNEKIADAKKILYKKGKIRKTELSSLETEKAKLRYEEASLYYNQQMLFYQLEYLIEFEQ